MIPGRIKIHSGVSNLGTEQIVRRHLIAAFSSGGISLAHGDLNSRAMLRDSHQNPPTGLESDGMFLVAHDVIMWRRGMVMPVIF